MCPPLTLNFKLLILNNYLCGEGGLGLRVDGKQPLDEVQLEIGVHFRVHGEAEVQRRVDLDKSRGSVLVSK